MAHLPVGFSSTSGTITTWDHWRMCRADGGSATCCVSMSRTIDHECAHYATPARGPNNEPQFHPAAPCRCSITARMAQSKIVCLTCAQFDEAAAANTTDQGPQDGDAGFYAGALRYREAHTSGEAWEEQCSFSVQYAVVLASVQRWCESDDCEQSQCKALENPSGSSSGGAAAQEVVYTNPRCSRVVPAMVTHCHAIQQEVAAACAAGRKWWHPSERTKLLRAWAERAPDLNSSAF
eukprot:3694216-Prymnesium_polylepis.1